MLVVSSSTEITDGNDTRLVDGRTFARLNLNPPQDSEFIRYISRSESLQALSSLPYHCNLLLTQFTNHGSAQEFSSEFDLIDFAISEIIEREIHKETLHPLRISRRTGFNHGLKRWGIRNLFHQFQGHRAGEYGRLCEVSFEASFIRRRVRECNHDSCSISILCTWLAKLLKDTGSLIANPPIANPTYSIDTKTPEIYLGSPSWKYYKSPCYASRPMENSRRIRITTERINIKTFF
jgi:hypothetical protein